MRFNKIINEMRADKKSDAEITEHIKQNLFELIDSDIEVKAFADFLIPCAPKEIDHYWTDCTRALMKSILECCINKNIKTIEFSVIKSMLINYLNTI